MDTEYIKMADCPEIQEQKERNYLHKSAMGQITHGLDGSVYWGKPTDEIIPPFVVPMPLAIWLPDQAQLQEMVRGDNDPHCGAMITRFTDWYNDTFAYAPSMEQLWLAFVMKEKYGKVWKDEGWVIEGGEE